MERLPAFPQKSESGELYEGGFGNKISGGVSGCVR